MATKYVRFTGILPNNLNISDYYKSLTVGQEYEVDSEDNYGVAVLTAVNTRWLDPGEFEFVPEAPAAPVTATQVGGSHYTNMKIQPIEYIMANEIPFAEGNVIKYVSRWRKKGGVQDLKKARHMLDTIIEAAEKGDYE